VNIQPGSQTAAEGALFQTRGLEFTLGDGRERLALAVITDASISRGISSLGGERRTVSWRQCSAALPACPREIRQEIVRSRSCRVVLVTPGCFERGWLPGWLIEERHGVKPHLRGAAVQRPQVVSGWDFSRATATENGRPKPSRRLAASGTVFFLSLVGDETATGRWVDETWMSCASDDPQDRLDGFGLTVLGTWSGELRQMR
jgi:CRISPR-associated protein Cmr3